jgi:hypothetical protein
MKVVAQEGRASRTPIDYTKLAELYNALEVGGAVEMDSVYNITNFKEALTRRGLVMQKDASAFNLNGKTLVKRLSMAVMTQE